MILPAIVLGLGAAALIFKKKMKGGAMTPQRQAIYQSALASADAGRMRELAKAFRAEGLTDEADMLEKRARLRDLPPEVKAQRKAAFKAAMSSKDKASVLRMVDAYEREGATGAAEKLREYAKGL